MITLYGELIIEKNVRELWIYVCYTQNNNAPRIINGGKRRFKLVVFLSQKERH